MRLSKLFGFLALAPASAGARDLSLQAPTRPATVMLEKILQFFLIACSHRKLSKPHAADFDDGRNADWMPVGNGPSHYVVCLDCGKKFDYDWRNMRVVR